MKLFDRKDKGRDEDVSKISDTKFFDILELRSEDDGRQGSTLWRSANTNISKFNVMEISLDDYLGQRGLRSPISGYMDDKWRNVRLTARGQKRFEKEAEAAKREEPAAPQKKAAQKTTRHQPPKPRKKPKSKER